MLSRKHTIPILWSVLIPGIAIGIYFLVYWNWQNLPAGLRVVDEPPHEPVFIAERAHTLLRTLTSQGPRVVGSDTNEIFTVRFLVDTLRQISWDADPSNVVSVEVQEASGSMFLDRENYPMTSYYRGVQNVVATVRKRDDEQFSGKYLLLNAHFDSVITSPGAGDDGTMTVVMLEVLRQISKVDLKLKHGLIFLFNGCEENTMQGAHGFVTGHPLAKNVSAFLNLDIAANEGREMMFQTVPNYPFLMDYYRKYVKRPYANSLAEEIFQLGWVPSFTDFEVFSGVGEWPGMDFALASYGYLYHTKYDAFESISPRTLQHIGDNILPLTIGLAQADELLRVDEHVGGSDSFFDYLHLFHVKYSQVITLVINSLVAIIGLGLIITTIVLIAKWEKIRLIKLLLESGITLVIQILSIGIGAGLSIAVAVIMDELNLSMSWFTSNWLVFGLFFIPTLFGLITGPWLYIRYRKIPDLNKDRRILLFLHAQNFIFIALLLTLTVQEIRSGYILLFPVLFHSGFTAINLLIKFKFPYWIIVQVLGQVIPFFYFCSLSITVFTIMIPMSGRSDPGENPDILIAMFSILMALFLFGLLLPLLLLLRKIRYFYTVLILMFITTIILVVSPVGFPYREGVTPQRHHIFHQERIFRFQNGTTRYNVANYFAMSSDRHTQRLLQKDVPRWKGSASIMYFCQEELFCGFPTYHNRYHRYREHNRWLTALSFPVFPHPVNLVLQGVQDLSLYHRRFQFTLEGPTLMGLYVSAKPGGTLKAWSFSDRIPSTFTPWNDQEVHYVNLIQAKTRSPLEFYIDIATASPLTSEPILMMNVVGNYMHHEQYHVEEFRNLVGEMPSYAHTVAYPNFLENREF
ncbi:endoplasmic reticulum metallopeptidase 1-like [Uranotaenia lowii]|uniref:endoplasmic reticulum metallopeptidase 1-like n=1 Tax=Uranotaenia lowii TaxID=190385 RepID=UPI002479D6D4|nr:endoplasmic reticulum metallopeptidase 1-like [Uranotaenia lowii]